MIARLKRSLDRALPSGWDNGWTNDWSVWAPYLLMQDLREFAFAQDRTPDVLVRPSGIEPSGPRQVRHAFGAPVLGIDVVPAEDYRGDLATKLGEYAELGLPRFWLLDLGDRVLQTFALIDGLYQEAARLDDETPAAALETGAGAVRISLHDLLSDHSADAGSRGRVPLPENQMITKTFSLMPASWDDYECYAADGPRQDYLAGDLFARRAPTWEERVTIRWLRDALSEALPSRLQPVRHAIWKSGPVALAADLMVVPSGEAEACFVLDVPTLVIEVVEGNSAAHTAVKVQQYARAGAARYWIVDVRDRQLLCLELLDGTYQVRSQLDDHNPVADLETGAGALRVSLPELFKQPFSYTGHTTAAGRLAQR